MDRSTARSNLRNGEIYARHDIEYDNTDIKVSSLSLLLSLFVVEVGTTHVVAP